MAMNPVYDLQKRVQRLEAAVFPAPAKPQHKYVRVIFDDPNGGYVKLYTYIDSYYDAGWDPLVLGDRVLCPVGKSGTLKATVVQVDAEPRSDAKPVDRIL